MLAGAYVLVSLITPHRPACPGPIWLPAADCEAAAAGWISGIFPRRSTEIGHGAARLFCNDIVMAIDLRQQEIDDIQGPYGF